MTNRKLGTLAIVAVLMAALTTALYSAGQGPRAGFASGSLLIQGLAPEKIHSIVIKHGDAKVTIQRQGDKFVLAEKDGYPASIKRINDLLKRCLDVRCAAKITSSQSNQKALGVADDSPEATSISFIGADQKPLIGFVMGKSGERGLGPYVRLAGQNAVYAAASYLYVDTDPLSYADRNLVTLKTDDVQSVKVQTPDGAYTIARGKDGKVALQDIPKGKQAKGTTYKNVFDALSRLDMSDVAKADSLKLKWDGTYTCTLKDGTTYTVRSAEKGDKPYVVVSSTGKATDGQQDGWVYQVSTWDAGNLRKPLSDLIEDIPVAKAPAEISASHILIAYKGAERSKATRTKAEAKALAEKVLAKAQAKGADFAALARQYSDGPSAGKGGDLGSFKKGAMDPAFEAAAFKLKVGQVSGVVETPFGFHIIKRTK